MSRRLIASTVALTMLVAPAVADDLYKVRVGNRQETGQLATLGIDPVLRLNDGYLVLADPSAAQRLESGTLDFSLIAQGVSREQLAVDGRRDRANAERLTPLFVQDDVRVFLLESADEAGTEGTQLFPLKDRRPPIHFSEPAPKYDLSARTRGDLQELIAHVNTDSLHSYVTQLQAFAPRVNGSQANRDARDWIRNKFSAFGYDSLFLDPFVESQTYYNVVATKLGTTYPDVHVVVGAHFDAVSGSPGADDNASGTAGVLELARILKDVPTELTFVFVTFDAEESGLYGSWFYADRAVSSGENVIYMLNMDMIGHYENTTEAALYYGSDRSYSDLWAALADSLLGVTGVMSGGSGGSDHYPFAQNGFPVTFVAENIFSTVYHSYRDSTTYMDFNYMTLLVKASLATAFVVGTPQPSLAFEYPGGAPVWLSPTEATTFQVGVTSEWGGNPAPGTGQLHYSVDGGAFNVTPLADLGSNLYEATIPAVGCVDRVEYYVSCNEMNGATFTDPAVSSPLRGLVASVTAVVLNDNFQANQGWTVSGSVADGPWERAIPSQGGTRGDPPFDFDGSGFCYVTDNGVNGDVDGGTTILTSPLLDFSSMQGRISYARWYSNSGGSDPNNDVMLVYVTNGSQEALVETVGPSDQASGGWYTHSFVLQDFVEPTATVRVRFEVSDLSSPSLVEAAVDAFAATAYICAPPLSIITPALPAATLGSPYSCQLEAENGSGQIVWTDKFGGLEGSGVALSSDGLLSGTPSHSGILSFTARASDAHGQSDEQTYDLEILTCCVGRVGDANGSGEDMPTIGDISALIDAKFITGSCDGILGCMAEADMNRSGGANPTCDDITIGDISMLIDCLFITGEPPFVRNECL